MVWKDGMAFEGTTTTGHKIIIDASREGGGEDRGPKPIELLLTGLAGCTAMDVLSVLRKKREPLKGLEVYVEGERAGDHPMVYKHITIVYRVYGDVNDASVARAVELSNTKYCGVHAMLEKTAHIHSRYEIIREKDMTPVPAS
ncbi:MAG: OsmC family protein [Chloroflexi bacterium]|nr:OsmC family protein [Chloroflexota bacterium]